MGQYVVYGQGDEVPRHYSGLLAHEPPFRAGQAIRHNQILQKAAHHGEAHRGGGQTLFRRQAVRNVR